MTQDEFDFVSPHELRIGLFVDLDGGWMAHPFASSRFRIATHQQLQALKGLGAAPIRIVPARCDPPSVLPLPALLDDAPATTRQAREAARQAQQAQQEHAALRSQQQHSLALCEKRFFEASQQYRKTAEALPGNPAEAARISLELVQGLNQHMQEQGETAIRLLSDAAGDKVAQHPVNVAVMCLLLGRVLGLPEPALQDLGLAAWLHDMGKLELPARVRTPDPHHSPAENKAYQSHVGHSLRLARSMALSHGTLQAIAQHQELADGSGFPDRLTLESIGMGARILSLVNRFDGLCNPARPQAAMTPHEALALIFSQQKHRFDGTVLSAFVRMVGVYPPGSVVQLNDERHALVVAVNAARPLKPRVIVHDAAAPRHEALVLDLEHMHQASIRRSIKPANLSAAARDYLRPPQRLNYFFEAVEAGA